MAKRPKSEALAALHETMQDLHSVGAIDARRMREFDKTCLADGAKDAVDARYIVFQDASDMWRWRLLSETGEVLAEGGQAYQSEQDALDAIQLARKALNAAVAG